MGRSVLVAGRDERARGDERDRGGDNDAYGEQYDAYDLDFEYEAYESSGSRRSLPIPAMKRSSVVAAAIVACAAAAIVALMATELSNDSVSAELTLDETTATTGPEDSSAETSEGSGPPPSALRAVISVPAEDRELLVSPPGIDESTSTSQGSTTTDSSVTASSSADDGTASTLRPLEVTTSEPPQRAVTTAPTTTVGDGIVSTSQRSRRWTTTSRPATSQTTRRTAPTASQPPSSRRSTTTERRSTTTERRTTTTRRQPTTTRRTTTTTRRTTTTARQTTSTTMQHPPHGGAAGQWVRVQDESARYNERIKPTTHHFFDPFSSNAPPGWGASRIGFVVHCESVLVKQIDPIVSPGTASHHMHEFFGNPVVTANSTTQSLIDVPTSRIECTDTNDKSAYWTPTASQGGRRVTSVHYKAYYKSPKANTQPMPLGLRMVAGDAKATRNQPRHVGWWESGKDLNTAGRNSMISRKSGNKLTLRINFPECWDGKHLDSPDHKSHMAYASGGGCPGSHPVRLPQLVTFTDYNTDGGPGFGLSVGEWYQFHQDFWNGWAPDQMEALNRRCGQASMNCRARKSPDLVPRGQFPAEVAGR